MKDFHSASMCDVIDITLYKTNYLDNLIFTKCLNQLDYTIINEDSILVTPHQLRIMFDMNFERQLRRLGSVSAEHLHASADSIYFIHRFLEDFTNLKWVRLNLDRSRNFTRLVESNGQKQIKFSFKILKATIRLSHFLELDDIKKINHILKKYDLLDDGVHYKSLKSSVLLNQLDAILNIDETIDDDSANIIVKILESIEFKVEIDDPDVLLVTDW